jgi:microcystin-dependent protein
MGGFERFESALRGRDVLERLIRNVINRERPRPRYGEVLEISRTQSRCLVRLNGDTTSVLIPMGAIQPLAVGQIVRVEGVGTDRYITDVIGGAASGFAPVGAFYPFAGTVLPAGYLWCDGAAVSRTTYADLFAAIGTSYGSGNGSTTFNVPDLGGRVPVGYDSGDSDFNANGKTGGAKTHTLTVSEMPSHNHGGATGSGGSGTTGSSGTLTTNNTTPDYRWYPSTGGGNHGAIAGSGSATAAAIPNGSHNHTIPSHTHSIPNHTHSISSQGGGAAHNNMQPYVVARYIIRY